MTAPEHAGAILTIDLGAIAANWRLLRDRLGGAECGAVIKADAYGLGLKPVAETLWRAGCRSYFVALTSEGVALRAILPQADIFVLQGLAAGEESDMVAQRLVPVLNAIEEIARWRGYAHKIGGAPLSGAIMFDTGMSRLGLEPREAQALASDHAALDGIALSCLMSHLVVAEERDNPITARQLADFNALRRLFPPARGSICNSSAAFLGREYALDLARPGAAIFGLAPLVGEPNPMAPVVTLKGRILQVREIDSPRTVGYGATHRATAPMRVATVAVGYADGYLRSLSSRGSGFLGENRVKVVGRVSMDLITFDVTGVPAHLARAGELIELIGPRHTPDDLAEEAGTIGYEILTGLGPRYHRVYKGEPN
jgi:alanine racemase